jgi:hypothetical protein
MIEPYSIAYDISSRINPDAWIICETYSSFAIPNKNDVYKNGASALSDSYKRMLNTLPDEIISTCEIKLPSNHAASFLLDSQKFVITKKPLNSRLKPRVPACLELFDICLKSCIFQ